MSLDEADRVWLFLHSGSRGVGNKLAQHHIRSRRSSARAGSSQLPDRDLAYLVEGEPEFDAYIEALRWAQRFALLNREEMMDRVVDQPGRFLGEPSRAGRDGQLPPQLHRAGDALRPRGVAVAQGGDLRARGRSRG